MARVFGMNVRAPVRADFTVENGKKAVGMGVNLAGKAVAGFAAAGASAMVATAALGKEVVTEYVPSMAAGLYERASEWTDDNTINYLGFAVAFVAVGWAACRGGAALAGRIAHVKKD